MCTESGTGALGNVWACCTKYVCPFRKRESGSTPKCTSAETPSVRNPGAVKMLHAGQRGSARNREVCTGRPDRCKWQACVGLWAPRISFAHRERPPAFAYGARPRDRTIMLNAACAQRGTRGEGGETAGRNAALDGWTALMGAASHSRRASRPLDRGYEPPWRLQSTRAKPRQTR
eukprot:2805905-Prymnesium_polylepis.2